MKKKHLPEWQVKTEETLDKGRKNKINQRNISSRKRKSTLSNSKAGKKLNSGLTALATTKVHDTAT